MRCYLALVVVGLLASMSAEVEAQYPRYYVQGPPTGYYYVYPNQHAHAPIYQPVVPRYTRPPNPTGYVNRPYYGAYGYGNYSNGSTDGFPPFRGRRSR
jgi:hypothetical protein